MTTAAQRLDATPYRQSRKPSPVAYIRYPDAAEKTLAAIRAIDRHRGCLAYLYVLADGGVYVISEERPAAGQWMLEHVECWRGCYTRGVTLDDVAADLA